MNKWWSDSSLQVTKRSPLISIAKESTNLKPESISTSGNPESPEMPWPEPKGNSSVDLTFSYTISCYCIIISIYLDERFQFSYWNVCRLQSQMKTNLEMARDRLEFLSKLPNKSIVQLHINLPWIYQGGLSDLHRLPINSEVEEVAHPPRKLLTMNEDCSSTNGPPSSGARLLKKKPVLTPTSTAHTAGTSSIHRSLSAFLRNCVVRLW